MAERDVYRFKQDKNDKKNTTIIIGVLLVLIVVVGAFLLFILFQKPANGDVTSDNSTIIDDDVSDISNDTNDTMICDDPCKYINVLESGNSSGCDEIMTNDLKQDCYEYFANISFSACTALEDKKKKEKCITHFAIDAGDVSICELLEDDVTTCKEKVFSCANSADKDLCYAIRDNDPSNCGQSDLCLLNYSVIKSDPASCDLISDISISTGCNAVVGNTDKCVHLPGKTQRDMCYEIFAIYSNSMLTCTQISPDSIYAITCFSEFAVRMHDLSICNRTELVLNSRWDCFTNYAFGSGDITGCSAIDMLASTARFNCAFEFAKKYGDPSACDIIQRMGARDTCYQGAILYSNENLNPDNCHKVNDFNWKNKCYSEAAKVQDDESICDRIDTDYAREACHIAYDVYQTNKED